MADVPAACRAQKLGVLCVDDDPVSMRVVAASLARPGWVVECVCDASQALDRFERDAHAFDILITDHAMPDVDGVMLVQRLRALGFAGPVIVVTASLTPTARRAYLALGAAAILIKPIIKSQLLATVQRVVATLGAQSAQTAAISFSA